MVLANRLGLILLLTFVPIGLIHASPKKMWSVFLGKRDGLFLVWI